MKNIITIFAPIIFHGETLTAYIMKKPDKPVSKPHDDLGTKFSDYRKDLYRWQESKITCRVDGFLDDWIDDNFAMKFVMKKHNLYEIYGSHPLFIEELKEGIDISELENKIIVTQDPKHPFLQNMGGCQISPSYYTAKLIKYSEERTVENYEYEREWTIKTLRTICERHGDIDWNDNLHIGDILNKHLINHVEQKQQDYLSRLSELELENEKFKLNRPISDAIEFAYFLEENVGGVGLGNFYFHDKEKFAPGVFTMQGIYDIFNPNSKNINDKHEKDLLRQSVKYNRLLGEYMGTLRGICAWDIPTELRDKLEKLIPELEKLTPHTLKDEATKIVPDVDRKTT